MDFRSKILTLETLPAWRERLRAEGKKLAVTNGCFDILHLGHVNYLAAARAQADALLVGVNSDGSIRQLKGAGRPVNPETDRALVVAALQSVDAVCVFDELRATLLLALVLPDIYVKGGDYAVEQLPQEERDVITQCGGRIVVLGHVPGKSTSGLIEKITKL
ncbi:MAG: ADP-heptose synthase [Pedosphaera sp.]|nr:ADP-heptose synthase [Pedosphaera sp.]MST00695.1 ADP-heptose synthase [Pedosphaera sp.]